MKLRLICRDSGQISPDDWNTFYETFDVHLPLALATTGRQYKAKMLCTRIIGAEVVDYNDNDLPKELSEAGMIFDAIECAGESVHLLAMAAKKINQDCDEGARCYAIIAEAAENIGKAVQSLSAMMKARGEA